MLLHTFNTPYYSLHISEGQGRWFHTVIRRTEQLLPPKSKDLYLLDVTADCAADLGTDANVDLIEVEYNANNIALNIKALHGLGSKLSNITLTDC